MKDINKKYCCWYCGNLLENTGESYLYRPASFVLRCNNHGKYLVDFCGYENQYIEGLVESVSCINIYEKKDFENRDNTIPICYIMFFSFVFIYAFHMGNEIEFPSDFINYQPEVIAEKIKNKIKTLIAFA